MDTNVKFSPSVVTRRAKRLLYGTTYNNGTFLPGLLSAWVGENLSADTPSQFEFANDVINLLKIPEQDIELTANQKVKDTYIDITTVHSSCSAFFSEPITVESVTFIAWRLAANVDMLLANQYIPAWSPPGNPVTVPVQIIGTYPKHKYIKGQNELGNSIIFKVIAGLHCPVVFSRWLSNKLLYVVAKEIGLSPRRSKIRFTGHRNELFGTRFLVQLICDKFNNTSVTFDEFHPGQFKIYNRSLQLRRKDPCPAGVTLACHECPVGVDKCPDNKPISRACRPLTLAVKFCTNCNAEKLHENSTCENCRCKPEKFSKG